MVEATTQVPLEERIAAYLRHQLPAARDLCVRGLVRIPGGASRVTWSCDARWMEEGASREAGLILRLDPEASLLDSNREMEYRVYAALQGTGLPLPRVYWNEPDPRWLGRPFFVLERVAGESAPALLMSPRWQPIHDRVGRQFAEHLASIHALDWRERGLESLGVPDSAKDCAAREVDRWETALRRDALEPQPVLNLAIRWLRRNQPPARRIALVHGDYRTGNYLFDDSGITAILDWEMAHLGDPLEDVGWAGILYWRFGSAQKLGGILEREEFYNRYEAAGGEPVDRDAVRFWEVLGNLKMAVISLTGARSFCEGANDSGTRRQGGPLAATEPDGGEIEMVLGRVGRGVPSLEAEIMGLLGR